MNVHIKTNSCEQAAQPEDIAHFMQILSCVPDVHTACWMGNAFLSRTAPDDLKETTVALSHVHPFFLPVEGHDVTADRTLSLGEFAETVLRARLTANKAGMLNILVADAPGSIASSLGNAIRTALALRPAHLLSAAYSDYSASLLGANLSASGLDELALQRNGLDVKGSLAQHPVPCTPYTARQIALYGLRPIVVTGNFLVSLIVLDDTLMQSRARDIGKGESFFEDGLPACYQHLPLDQRLDLLVDVHAVRTAQWLATWQKSEACGAVKPLWISRETDLLGNLGIVAQKIADFVGPDRADVAAIADALAQERATDPSLSDRGLAYRAKLIPAKSRDRAMAIFECYAGDADLSSVIGLRSR